MRTECSDIFSQLESWYDCDSGRYLLDATHAAAQRLLDRAFGYHLLHLGYQGERPLSESSPINHRIICTDRAGATSQVIASPDELPIESDSIDVVVAHHCLEFSHDPHQVLREIQRVLTPQGQLLVVGFNPWSVTGIAGRSRGLAGHSLWRHHHPVSERRLSDWMQLLGCEVQEVARVFTVPPVGRGRLHQGLKRLDQWAVRHNLPLGGVYIAHAVKQVAGMNRPQRVVRARSGRLIGLVSNPAPSPTPVTPAPPYLYRMEKGDVAA